jgi:hypothetical protein
MSDEDIPLQWRHGFIPTQSKVWALGKLIGLAVALMAFAPIMSAQRTIWVTGRAVDDHGIPVSKLVVTLYFPPCRNCFEHLLPSGLSLSDGYFVVDAGGGSLKNLSLFVSEPIPAGFWSPLNEPSFEELSHPGIFRSIPIRIRKGQRQVDLGDVVVRNRYAKVILELPTTSLGENRSGSNDRMQVSLSLLDSRKRVIYSDFLPMAALTSDLGPVNLALPKGRWTLKFLVYVQGKKISSIHEIDVKEFSAPIKLTL